VHESLLSLLYHFLKKRKEKIDCWLKDSNGFCLHFPYFHFPLQFKKKVAPWFACMRLEPKFSLSFYGCCGIFGLNKENFLNLWIKIMGLRLRLTSPKFSDFTLFLGIMSEL
jgi:hypothetical protein